MDVVHILLVEDNEGDIILTTEAFKDMQLENRISVVSLPQLILMDIHLPGINGKDLLEIIKQDEELKEIPVVMLTSSDKDADISDCYDKQVNWYITKPIDYDKYTKVMHEIEAFYVSFVPYDKMMR